MHGECVLALAHAHRAQQLPALGIYARSDAHDKAVAYLEQAGDRAQGQQAHATAEGYYRPRRLRSLDHCKFAKARIP